MRPPDQPGKPDVRTMERFLSSERLHPYMVASRGRSAAALELYRWNIVASAAVYETLHLVEVVLRNTIDARLREWNRAPDPRDPGSLGSPAWSIEPRRSLAGLVGADLSGAHARATKAVARSSAPRREVTHGDVVAQLTFGTWRYLLPALTLRKSPSKAALWHESLAAGFPHLLGDHRQLVHDVANAHSLRNRVAHLEPLIRPGVIECGAESMRRVVAAIHPDVADWHDQQSRIDRVLRDRPEAWPGPSRPRSGPPGRPAPWHAGRTAEGTASASGPAGDATGREDTP